MRAPPAPDHQIHGWNFEHEVKKLYIVFLYGSIMSPRTESEKFHSYSHNYHDPIPKGLESGLITKEDAKLIKSFVYEHSAISGSSDMISVSLTRILIRARRWSGPYSTATIEDLYKIVDGVKNDVSKTGKQYSAQTQAKYINRSKIFFTWLSDNKVCHIPAKKIQVIKLPTVFNGVKSAASLLTQDEVLQIIGACHSSRNRAFFSMLYEGGFRVGEVATMKWGDLVFDSAGIIANVLYKTNKPRYIRLVVCKEALSKWKSDYPEKITDDSYVFLSTRGGILKYHAVMRMMQRAVNEAGITKPVNLHLFRHSRITHLIQAGVPESIIKLIMWGSTRARSFKIYAHLSGSDVDREILKMYGIDNTIAEKPASPLEPQICPNCKEICGPTSRYCSVCGQPLNETDIKNADALKKWLMENRDLLTEFLNNTTA